MASTAEAPSTIATGERAPGDSLRCGPCAPSIERNETLGDVDIADLEPDDLAGVQAAAVAEREQDASFQRPCHLPVPARCGPQRLTAQRFLAANHKPERCDGVAAPDDLCELRGPWVPSGAIRKQEFRESRIIQRFESLALRLSERSARSCWTGAAIGALLRSPHPCGGIHP